VRRTSLRRTGGLKPGKKGFRTYEWQAEFRAAVLERDGGCVVADWRCYGVLDAHHIIEKGTLHKRGMAERAADPDGGVCLCRYHHVQHHARIYPLTWEHVPTRAKDFADGLGLLELLARTYPTREDT
jgi:hypothetical protein